jgi:hydroxyethylthiazole kinase-like uncharacterized protein yjeF
LEKVFKEVHTLDNFCYSDIFLTEEILMENASTTISNYIKNRFPKGSSLVVVSGSGHNGADGIVVARQLCGDFRVKLYLSAPPKSELARFQLKRALAVGVERIYKLEDGDIILDALFGSGLKTPITDKFSSIINDINSFKGFKIACDIPSGVDSFGNVDKVAVKSDVTITMGALKIALFSDVAKDLVGEVLVADLGISRKMYESKKSFFNLEESDIKLPHRTKKATHKGSYGHVAVLSGEREGASTISALASLNFGAGLVSVVSVIKRELPFELMQSREVPENSSVIIAGMGLGKVGLDHFRDTILNSSIPLVLDADALHEPSILKILSTRPLDIVLTPHPKEFASMLFHLFDKKFTVSEVVEKRVELVQMFSDRYPNVTLLLKGANRIIAGDGDLYFDTLGEPNLAKAGSGDVLAGMIGALIAQGYSPLDATISGSLAHGKASKLYQGNSFSLSPIKLINEFDNI